MPCEESPLQDLQLGLFRNNHVVYLETLLSPNSGQKLPMCWRVDVARGFAPLRLSTHVVLSLLLASSSLPSPAAPPPLCSVTHHFRLVCSARQVGCTRHNAARHPPRLTSVIAFA